MSGQTIESPPANPARTYTLLDGKLMLQLLPGAPYSASDPAQFQTLGISLQRQRGVHAIASDRRVDFDTLPGVLAYTPAGIDVFSESADGGEYLLVRWTKEFFGGETGAPTQRVEISGHARALDMGRQIRRMMFSPQPDLLRLEECVLGFIDLHPTRSKPSHSISRLAAQRILERISDELGQALTLTSLAASEGKSELRFLRDFKRAVGMTPHAYLVETRLQAARRMIQQTRLPLADIALECGFAHQSHMGSAFQAALGISPGQYRQLCRG
ncbi:MAG: AraC family transcriptional regulator [Pseudomonadota bacterium]